MEVEESRKIEKRTDRSPLISCLVPIYNGERFIRECVESILNQTYTNIELILVNDGSTDRSLDIISEYKEKDSRIKIIDQPNAGIVAALNAALALAKGEYIARMDADDISLPNRFEIQRACLDQDKDVVLVGGRRITIDAEGKVLDSDDLQRKQYHHERRMQTDLGGFPPKVATALHPLIMMRADAIKAIGGYRAGYRHAEDYDMYIRISRYGKLKNIDDVILKYRLHGHNISTEHTFEQEYNAARSEIDNINSSLKLNKKREIKISEQTFYGYVTLRTFRREIGLNILNYQRALKALGLILLGAPRSNLRTTLNLLAIWLFNNKRYIEKRWKLPEGFFARERPTSDAH